MYRVEDKFLVSEKELMIIQSKLETILCKDQNQMGQDGYNIASVYFDDNMDTCYRDAEDGIRMRKKYRIRVYDHSFDTIKLEVKYKWNNRVMKKSQTISGQQMKELMEGQPLWGEKESVDSAITLFNVGIAKDMLRPKVIVEYERTAFIYEPGNVRITLDRNIRASNDLQSFAEQREWSCDPVYENDCVLEVKYDEFLPGFIARVLENGNMIQTAYSKYRICREREGRFL